jgi:carbon dioxide concentrating mechanism protein CcmO
VANVVVAIEAGMHEADRIGELSSVMVIPRLLEDLEDVLPIASCWLDQPEPLPVMLPKEVAQTVEPELVEIPQRERELVEIPRRQEIDPVPRQTLSVEVIQEELEDEVL